MKITKKILKGFLMVVMCVALCMPSITVNASEATRDNARTQISTYMNTLINQYVPSAGVQQQLALIYNEYYNLITDTTDDTTNSGYISAAKTKMDAVIATVPTSAVSYLMVTDNIGVPIATYGQQCKLTMSLMCLADMKLTDIIVTPITSTDVSVWPFEIASTGDAHVIKSLQGSTDHDTAYKNRKEFDYFFTTRSDVLNGIYEAKFNVTYKVGGQSESQILTYYVNAVGASGSGSVSGGDDTSATSTPRIIVTGYKTNPEVVYAGDTFTITIDLMNTSSRTDVSNMQVDLQAALEGTGENTYEAFLPTSGSNSLYVSKIGKGKTTSISIELEAKADLAQKPYALDVSMAYEDEQCKPYTTTASVSIPIKQEYKFDTSEPEVMPNSIDVGSQSNVMFSIYNTGKTTLYNVQVKFVADSISGGDTFVGPIAAGATGNVDAMLSGEMATMDDGTVMIEISYEDEAGNVTTVEKTMNLYVMEQSFDMGGDEWVDDGYYEEEPASTGSVGLIIGIIVAVVVAGAVVLIIVKANKKKKANKELMDDLDDLDVE